MMAQSIEYSEKEVILPESDVHFYDDCVCVMVNIHNGFLNRGDIWKDCLPDVTVVVKKNETINNGDVVVALLNGEIIMKCLKTEDDEILLTEPQSEPVFVTNEDVFQIIGKPVQACFAFK